LINKIYFLIKKKDNKNLFKMKKSNIKRSRKHGFLNQDRKGVVARRRKKGR